MQNRYRNHWTWWRISWKTKHSLSNISQYLKKKNNHTYLFVNLYYNTNICTKKNRIVATVEIEIIGRLHYPAYRNWKKKRFEEIVLWNLPSKWKENMDEINVNVLWFLLFIRGVRLVSGRHPNEIKYISLVFNLRNYFIADNRKWSNQVKYININVYN